MALGINAGNVVENNRAKHKKKQYKENKNKSIAAVFSLVKSTMVLL